ncbi:fibrillin-3 [Sorex fumeus]|uniref:fibrillin-3 n=1 Tax=Sorex fumeus TaxID=62283 RepID=UPI0024AE1A59|nr:fibrillin-3 [Sorex fumeus]
MARGPPAQLLLAWMGLGCMVGVQGLWDGALEPAGPGRVLRRGGGPGLLQGPNVCGSRVHPYCCPGWRTRPGGHQCVVPVCRHACGPGFCSRPNLCVCASGQLAPSCGLSPGLGCRMSCMNGGSCRGDACLCPRGYTGTACGQPVCDRGCHNGGRCIGPGLCACVYGFMGPQCERDYRTGPCFSQMGPQGCQHQLPGLMYTKALCCATVGRAWGLSCERCPAQPHPCRRGFIPNTHTGACQDVDECAGVPGLCSGGRCINTVGSYMCSCPPGFATSQDGTRCLDHRSGPCYLALVRGQCMGATTEHYSRGGCCCERGRCWAAESRPELCPAAGSAESLRLCAQGPLPGFAPGAAGPGLRSPPQELPGAERAVPSLGLDGTHVDVDECRISPELCSPGACRNIPGSFECQCPPGYESSLALENRCVDVDECARDPQLCRDGSCLNTAGSFSCLCPPGHSLPPGRSACQDLDECAENSDLCPQGHCVNVVGTFHCACPAGFRSTRDRQGCVDVDECAETPGICNGGQCANSPGAHRCLCSAGFRAMPDARSCLNPHNCLQGAHANTKGSFVCHCPLGYSVRHGSAVGCSDVDECERGGPRCGPHASCLNVPGSFRCRCPPGWRGDGHKCHDLDECADPVPRCSPHARCFNTPGSYRCACRPGFLGNGLSCQDRDECAENADICTHGRCLNVPGGFRCECDPGFERTEDQRACRDARLGTCFLDLQPRGDGDWSCGAELGAAVPRGTCCCSLGGAWGSPCEPCPMANTTEHRTLCPGGMGFRPHPVTFILEDIDECQELPELCRGGDCANTFGSFRCKCPPGYHLSEDTRVCADINECLHLVGICWPGTCQNVQGSFHCICPSGFREQSDRCLDIDECSEEPSPCLFGTCTNSRGSFQCLCPPGFVLSDNGRHCLDTRLSFCFARFEAGKCLAPRALNTTKAGCCCSKRPGEGWNDPCELCPQEGSAAFQELCPFGHGVVPGPDDSQEDVNECVEKPDLCSGGLCINTDGSFRCECPPGSHLDVTGFNCVDTDECSVGQPCGEGTCTNVVGGFECACADGFEPGPLMTCEDIDECSRNPLLCAFRCINTEGSYVCICPAGYSLREDGAMCRDVDECAAGQQDCHARGMLCKNLIGTFTCVCPPGLRPQPGAGEGCTDEDECGAEPRPCAHGHCINTVGSFRCHCDPGFRPSPALNRCHDFRQGPCFSEVLPAACQSGWSGGEPVTHAECCCGGGRGWGPRCELCPLPGTPAHRTLCPHGPGYTAEGRDVDECRMLASLCPHGECVNSLGSFHCRCQAGFTADASATTCLDVDECSQTPKPCAFFCHNTEGSFLCACPRGYLPEEGGRRCGDIDECSSRRHNCQFFCANTIGAFVCRCPPGFTQHRQACFDSDECLNQPGPCGPHARCRNTPGSFSCECPKGFTLDGSGRGCQDVDECDGPHGCRHGCQNEPGGYRCHCPPGFTEHAQWSQCVDENECALSPEACGSAVCHNTLGSFRCVCPSGFDFDQALASCRDVDECASPGVPCSYGCANAPGGFLCGCPPGFFRAGQGHCVSSPAFSPGPQDPPEEGDQQPPEACYECRINGPPTLDRARRSAPGGDHQVSLASLDSTAPLTLSLDVSRLGPARHILDLRPALAGPGAWGRYVIVGGTGHHLFRLRCRRGLSTLLLRRKPGPGTYQLDVASMARPESPRPDMRPGPRAGPLRLRLLFQVL